MIRKINRIMFTTKTTCHTTLAFSRNSILHKRDRKAVICGELIKCIYLGCALLSDPSVKIIFFQSVDIFLSY
jgi:hypothetical protein